MEAAIFVYYIRVFGAVDNRFLISSCRFSLKDEGLYCCESSLSSEEEYSSSVGRL